MLWTDCTCLCHLGAPHEAPPPHTGPPSAELNPHQRRPKGKKQACGAKCGARCGAKSAQNANRPDPNMWSDLRKVVEPDSRLELLAYALRVPFSLGACISKRIICLFNWDYMTLYGTKGTCHNAIVVPVWCQMWCQVVKWGKHERPTEVHAGFCARNHRQGKGQKWPH